MFLLARPGAGPVLLDRKNVVILVHARVSVDTGIKLSILDARGGMPTRCRVN